MKKRISIVRISVYLLILLVIIAWLFIFIEDGADLTTLFSEKNRQFTAKFLRGLLGVGNASPAFLEGSMWQKTLELSFETFVMSIMAIGIATLGMLLTVGFAARNIVDGSLTLETRWYRWPLYYITHAFYIFTRAVPELLWAMLIVFILKPGILPGALALAIHNFGIMGKLCSEVIEDMKAGPITNLATSGASRWQLFTYGILPSVMNRFITYILYRWEVIIRTTIVVGFVGAGGLGQAFRLSMSFFKYTEITLYLICYIGLVYIADIISNAARKFISR